MKEKSDRAGIAWLLMACALLTAALVAGCQPITADQAVLPWRADLEATAVAAGEGSGEASEEVPSENDVSASDLDALSAAQRQLVLRATDDLAQQLGIETDEIALAEIAAVEWPDASLGCPQPDQMYAAVITPGYRITLAADDERYTYHTAQDAEGRIVNCDAQATE